jgi:two-component system chemotaxis response regulator CheY
MKRVLVVDDDPAVRKLVSDALQGEYAVDQATNGQQALESIQSRQPDAVILDMMMPVMDGWSFLEACRHEPSCAELPVLVVSAEPSACEDSRRLGATACVAKPFDINILTAAVEHLFVDDRSKVIATGD